MNTNLKNALISMAKFVADKMGLIALADFNNGLTHDLWAAKLAALAEFDAEDSRLALSHEEIKTAREAIEAVMGSEFIRMPVRWWTMMILKQAYACKGVSIEYTAHVLYVAKTTRPWAAPEALQALANMSSGNDSSRGFKECRKFQNQIARGQAIRESGLEVIRNGGDEFDALRAVVKGWMGADVAAPIAPVVPAGYKGNTTTAKVVGLK